MICAYFSPDSGKITFTGESNMDSDTIFGWNIPLNWAIKLWSYSIHYCIEFCMPFAYFQAPNILHEHIRNICQHVKHDLQPLGGICEWINMIYFSASYFFCLGHSMFSASLNIPPFSGPDSCSIMASQFAQGQIAANLLEVSWGSHRNRKSHLCVRLVCNVIWVGESVWIESARIT